ncbi:MAG TPA: hypothetical protein VKQ54_06215 [Caulobacteraceae bacterium]|nr:hypothetical protein [Caulobacteraceae bacterium]
MHSALNSWTCALVAAMLACRPVATVPGWANPSLQHGGASGASQVCAAGAPGAVRPALAAGRNGPGLVRATSMDARGRWFPASALDALDGARLGAYDPRTGDYVVYARAAGRSLDETPSP